ncbi:MAG: VOC family protein [Dehalococcoidia bacterium]|jgi:predicted enzyme related to lactoylglutathione lyase|nr:VOC family protein [Dehalococcoidia bacterium]
MPEAQTNTPIARLGSTAIDVNDLELEKKFWQTVLGVEIAAEPADYVFFKPQPGCSALTLQKVPEGKTGKNRVHLDLEVSDLDATVRQLEKLGASVVRPKPTEGFQWVVMADPEGNEFCIADQGS